MRSWLRSCGNWFLAAAFRGPDVSYWQALGLMIIIYLLKDNTVDEKANWKRLFVIVGHA